VRDRRSGGEGPPTGEIPGKNGSAARGYWLVNGHWMGHAVEADGNVWETMGDLLDVEARVQAVDEVGVDVHVI
jgi:hypothetical protein